MLRDLVLSIRSCKINESLIKEVNILIVDNDVSKTAEPVVNELKSDLTSSILIYYFSYPVKGLASVRNELIRQGMSFSPDYLVFIDDDEMVTRDWLTQMVYVIESNEGDMVMGPVNPAKNVHIPPSVSCWLERPDYPDNTRLNFIRTGNLIIRVKSLVRYQIWFEPQFNATGGEDSYFGIQMIKKGAKIYWAANAIVYETVPAERANLHWLIRRYYNGANIYTYILKVEKDYLRLFKKIIVSFFYIMAGLLAVILILIPIKRKYWGVLKISEGIGSLTGLLSIRVYEYK
jgi:cellulose synthase/poly-beta-1,6-N-acetylglucosamine synthase-like glycosyltransferase